MHPSTCRREEKQGVPNRGDSMMKGVWGNSRFQSIGVRQFEARELRGKGKVLKGLVAHSVCCENGS